MKRFKVIILVFFFLFLLQSVWAQVPAPEDVLGFKVGTDRKLADMHQILEYFTKLDRVSERIKVEEIGETTMGNPFIVAYITSVENHKNLEKYRKYQQMLADPRKISEEKIEEIIHKSKAVVMINCSLHASEIGASQMSMNLAYDLATQDDQATREILDNVILLLIPMHNPDGVQMVVDWYRKNLGTKYEGCRMPWLYHKYVGHDNNRDWYMFTQVESKLTVKVHNAWHPQVIMDMHQMGSKGPRLFVPPYVDPFEPNVDPILRQEIAAMGTFLASELTAQGKAGVIHSVWFDAWTPARAYHHYHGGIRVLTEVASADMATPVQVPLKELPEMVEESFKVQSELIPEVTKPQGKVEEVKDNFGYAWAHRTTDDIKTLNRIIKKGYPVFWIAEEFKDQGNNYPCGTMIVQDEAGLTKELQHITKECYVQFKVVKTKPEIKAYFLKPVRLGLYKSWTACMDEGWTRWVLEQYGFPAQYRGQSHHTFLYLFNSIFYGPAKLGKIGHTLPIS